MPFSKISIEFLIDFELDYTSSMSSVESGVSSVVGDWSWVVARSAGFEVTVGTPTGTPGETTALNFESAINLDYPTLYTTSVIGNTIEITSTTAGEDFVSFKANDELDGRIQEGTGFNVTYDNYVVPVDISNVEFTLTRSPHYISTPFYFETTVSATFELYVWSGDILNVPPTPTYTLTKIRPSIDYTEFNTNVSKLVGEQIDGKPTIDLSLPTQIVDTTDAEVKWFKYIASYNDPTIGKIADIEDLLISTDGYGYFLEGVNPTKPTNDILTSCAYRKVSRDGFVLLPFINNGRITSIDIKTENLELDVTETITSANNSNKAVQYLEIDLSQITTDRFLTVTFQPKKELIVTYEIDDECRYEPKQIIFKNRYGVYEVLTFFKKSNNSIKVTDKDFVNAYISDGTYSTTDHQKQKINIQGSESISLRSGYIKDTENSIYQEMLLSEKLYIWQANQLVPINKKTSSLEFKTRINDKLVNYNIDFEYAYNLIQNV